MLFSYFAYFPCCSLVNRTGMTGTVIFFRKKEICKSTGKRLEAVTNLCTEVIFRWIMPNWIWVHLFGEYFILVSFTRIKYDVTGFINIYIPWPLGLKRRFKYAYCIWSLLDGFKKNINPILECSKMWQFFAKILFIFIDSKKKRSPRWLKTVFRKKAHYWLMTSICGEP